jgi:hypothetical protein
MSPTGHSKDNPKPGSKMHTTTIRIPGQIYAFAKEVLESGEAEVTTLNDLVVSSLEDRLKKINESRIDARLARMAEDEAYQAAAVGLYELYDANASENLPGGTIEALRPAFKAVRAARTHAAHAKRAEALNE